MLSNCDTCNARFIEMYKFEGNIDIIAKPFMLQNETMKHEITDWSYADIYNKIAEDLPNFKKHCFHNMNIL